MLLLLPFLHTQQGWGCLATGCSPPTVVPAFRRTWAAPDVACTHRGKAFYAPATLVMTWEGTDHLGKGLVTSWKGLVTSVTLRDLVECLWTLLGYCWHLG